VNTTPQPNTDLSSTQQLWADLLPYETPDQYTINLFIRRHGVETVHYAVEQVALKRSKLNGQMERPYALRLFGAVCCSVTRARKHLAAK
jgi:hypothetical protein